VTDYRYLYGNPSTVKMDRTGVPNHYKGICSDVFNKLSTHVLNKSIKSFLMETLILYEVIPGRINFLQLGKYGKSCKQLFCLFRHLTVKR